MNYYNYPPAPMPPVYNPVAPYPDRLQQMQQPYQNPYQPQQQPQQAPQAAQPASNGILWVQGQEGAKSYLVQPGNTVLLMDSEGSRFYIKSADNAGLPQLRTFEFQEITGHTEKPAQPNVEYVARTEFDQLRSELEELKTKLPARKPEKSPIIVKED